jgi:hypothetical protein
MTDDRLDQQAGGRRGDPQDRQVVHVDAQGLEDAAGIGVLQAETDLDPEEPKAHVPDLEEIQPGLGHPLPPIARRFEPAMRKLFQRASWRPSAHGKADHAIRLSQICINFQKMTEEKTRTSP